MRRRCLHPCKTKSHFRATGHFVVKAFRGHFVGISVVREFDGGGRGEKQSLLLGTECHEGCRPSNQIVEFGGRLPKFAFTRRAGG